jgi:hypothetical protein
MIDEVEKAFKLHRSEVNKEYKQRPEVEERRFNKYLKKNYGITSDDYNKLYLEQGGKCAICNVHSSKLKKRLSVNVEERGILRGLLCNNCTSGLGNFKEEIEIIRNVIKYLNNITLFRE